MLCMLMRVMSSEEDEKVLPPSGCLRIGRDVRNGRNSDEEVTGESAPSNRMRS